MVCQKKPRNGIKLESLLLKKNSFCAIWKVQVPGEAWVVISTPCSPVLFFFSYVLSYLRDKFAPGVDGEGWLFPAWCFLGTPVPNQMKILWWEVQRFPLFPQVYLGPFCTDCFPEENEYFGASWTKKELCHAQLSYGLCNKD